MTHITHMMSEAFTPDVLTGDIAAIPGIAMNPVAARYGRRLAAYILAHQASNPDSVRRSWYRALFENLRAWPEQRRCQPSDDPWMACQNWVLARREEGKEAEYCEGLLIQSTSDTPEPAVWGVSEDELVVFSHDHLTLGAALHGMPLSIQSMHDLRWGFDLRGPYLFSDEPAIMGRFLQTRRPKVAQLRPVK